ncbi:MAG: alanine racemase [Desulfobacula sp.]|nr:alanine racemase [Desulfobacula sp.]
MDYPLVTAHIDLEAIGHNVSRLKNITDPQAKFMAVVKANAYGHGALEVAQKVIESGAHWLGVARLDEAVILRKAGIDAPILVFGYVHPSQAAMAMDLNLTITVYGLEMASDLSDQANRPGHPLPVHLKVDTGMGRVGMIIGKGISKKDLLNKELRKKELNNIEKIARLPGINLKGIYTHFASADSNDSSYTHLQIKVFESLLADLATRRIDFDIRHAANSAGIIEYPQSHFDMVRAGISLYGLYPSDEMDRSKAALVPAMKLTSIVSAVRDVPKGFCVSYGMTYRTNQKTRLASVPVGYADGYSRALSSKGQILVHGKRAPIIGRVCMDQTMIDVGHINGVKSGDEVVLIGRQKNEIISADELAVISETINYEIVSALTARVKRCYSASDSGSNAG